MYNLIFIEKLCIKNSLYNFIRIWKLFFYNYRRINLCNFKINCVCKIVIFNMSIIVI